MLKTFLNTRNDLSSLIKKVNGAENEFHEPTPLHLWRVNIVGFALLRKIFQPWQWKTEEREIAFEQTSRTLQKKISMRSTKDQRLKKRRSYACETQCFLAVEPSGCRRVLVCSVFFVCFRFSSGLDEKGKKGSTRCGQRTVEQPDVGGSNSSQDNNAVFAQSAANEN
ncbi:hypothetical protein TNCV_1515331 [Trichonephila clavipes]|nr:hypothetical protein TNCV_1515331 [Trichonephila clavipes]